MEHNYYARGSLKFIKLGMWFFDFSGHIPWSFKIMLNGMLLRKRDLLSGVKCQLATHFSRQNQNYSQCLHQKSSNFFLDPKFGYILCCCFFPIASHEAVSHCLGGENDVCFVKSSQFYGCNGREVTPCIITSVSTPSRATTDYFICTFACCLPSPLLSFPFQSLIWLSTLNSVMKLSKQFCLFSLFSARIF